MCESIHVLLAVPHLSDQPSLFCCVEDAETVGGTGSALLSAQTRNLLHRPDRSLSTEAADVLLVEREALLRTFGRVSFLHKTLGWGQG